jgi:hypothetical protein
MPSTLLETRGPTYPAPGSEPKKVVSYVQELIRDGDAAALARFKRGTHNLLFADGRQWIDWSHREKAYRDAPAPEGRIRYSMNYIRPILRARAQRMMSSELSWRCVPQSNAHEHRDKATVGTNLLGSRWKLAEMESKVRYALWLSFCCGVSYLKQFWNPDIGALTAATVILPHPVTGELAEYPIDQQQQPLIDEQGNPATDHPDAFRYRPGDTDSAVRSIFNVRLNPDAFGLEPAEGFRWLVDTEVVPISVVKERYGEAAKNVRTVEGIAQLKQFESLIKSISNAPQRNDLLTGRGGQQIPDKELTLLSEYWEAPSESLGEGRLVTIAGDELLYDGELPQGTVPYVALYDERRAFDAYGRPTVDDLVSPQKVINRQWSLILEEMALNGIGQWAFFDVPGLADQITNVAGGHIRIPVQSALANRSISEIVQRVQSAGVNPDRWRMIDAAKMVIFDLGAFHEVQRGQVPPGVESGIAIQLLQEAQNGQLSDSVRTLKNALVSWGRHTLRLARWGYGEQETRWIPVERPDLGYLVESVNGTDLPDPDTISIDLEGFRPTSQAALHAEVKEAMMQGWIAPRDGLQMMDLGRGIQGAFETETRHYARARGENLAIERGEYQLIEAPQETPLAGTIALVHPDGSPYLLPESDDHELHIRIHSEISLDDSKNWATRQVMLMHEAEHRNMLRLQAMAAQQTQLGAEQPPGPQPVRDEGERGEAA